MQLSSFSTMKTSGVVFLNVYQQFPDEETGMDVLWWHPHTLWDAAALEGVFTPLNPVVGADNILLKFFKVL